MSVAEQMTEVQDRLLSQMESAQERIIEMNQRVAEAISPVMDAVGQIPTPDLPGMEDVPKPEELVDRYFDFAAKMADANRKFYKDMFGVWSRPVEDAKDDVPSA